MIKVTQNQYYGKDSEVPAVLPAGSSMFTNTGKMYFYPEGKMIELNTGNASSSGLKKIVYALTQSGTDAPTLTLLLNEASLDISGVAIVRVTGGVYSLDFPTTDETLFDRFFPETNNHFANDKGGCAVRKDNGISKANVIKVEIFTTEDEANLVDDILIDTLFTINIIE